LKGFPLFLDEDSCDSDLVAALRNRDVDVTTVLEVGFQGHSDKDQLLWATNANRVIYTFNAKHFCHLHRIFVKSGQEHSGIIIGHQQRFPIGEQLRRILRVFNERSIDNMRNQIEFLSNWD
jgi:hypothetical protein